MRLSLKSTRLPGAGPSASWWLLTGSLNEGHTVGLEMLRESLFTEDKPQTHRWQNHMQRTERYLIARGQRDIEALEKEQRICCAPSSHFSGKWGLNQTFFLIHKLLTVFFFKYSDFFESPFRNLLGLPRLGR